MQAGTVTIVYGGHPRETSPLDRMLHVLVMGPPARGRARDGPPGGFAGVRFGSGPPVICHQPRLRFRPLAQPFADHFDLRVEWLIAGAEGE